MALFQCLKVPCADTFFLQRIWNSFLVWSIVSSVVFVFSVNAVTSCVTVMSKIPFVTLTNVACCYAQKFNSLYILAHECGQDSDVGIVICYGLDSLGIESWWK